jgi:hypothetical protein
VFHILTTPKPEIVEESFERGGDANPLSLPLDGIKDIGTKSWWKPEAKADVKAKDHLLAQPPVLVSVPSAPKGVEKEIEAVTERMIENANANTNASVEMDVGVGNVDEGMHLETVPGSTN